MNNQAQSQADKTTSDDEFDPAIVAMNDEGPHPEASLAMCLASVASKRQAEALNSGEIAWC